MTICHLVWQNIAASCTPVRGVQLANQIIRGSMKPEHKVRELRYDRYGTAPYSVWAYGSLFESEIEALLLARLELLQLAAKWRQASKDVYIDGALMESYEIKQDDQRPDTYQSDEPQVR